MTKKVKIRDSKKGVEEPANPSSSNSAKPLWEDDDDDDDDDNIQEQKQHNDNQDHRSVKISINSKFAQEFERKKQRQELQELEKQKALLGEDEDDHEDDDDSTTSSSEDEDGDLLITPAMDVQVLKTIQALKRKDETIYDPNVRFFPSTDSEEDSDDDDQPMTTKTTKKRFKDVIREQILEDVEKMDKQQQQQQRQRKRGEDDSDDEDDNDDEVPNKASTHFNAADRLAYDEEQRQLRKAFLQSHNSNGDYDDDVGPKQKDGSADGDEDWLVVKKKHQPSSQDEEMYVKELVNLEQVLKSSSKNTNQKKKVRTGKAQQPHLVDPHGEVEDGEQFLLEFLKKKKWKDVTTTFDHHDAEEDDDEIDEKDGHDDHDNNNRDDREDNDDSSLEQLEKTEAFESDYNFRFEQAEASGAALSLQSYARGSANNSSIAAGLLRRPDDTRKDRRLARSQRKAEERQAKEEQLRRLKNAKRQELQEKLNQIQSILGPTGTSKSSSKGADVMDEATLMKLLEGDFDPDQFEQVMTEAYGDDFYQQPDEEWKSDADVKKSFESGAVDEDDKEIAAAMLVADDDEADEGVFDDNMAGDEYDEGYEEEKQFLPQSKSNGAKQETEIEKKLKAKMLDELYKLDYEDIVAGIPTRFKYRQVEPDNYGLSTQEILSARDSLLQQVVSLKQMAPYREGQYTVNAKKRRRFREMLQQDAVDQPTYAGGKLGEKDRKQTFDSEDGTMDPTNKKRRRQKKRKTLTDGLEVNMEEGPIQANDSPATNGLADASVIEEDKNEGEPTKSKRRRRKKKSTTTTQTEEQESVSPDSKLSKKGVDSAESIPSDMDSEALNLTEQTKDKTNKNSSLSPSKKKKKKKLSVKGVSATRFASYGLALAMLVMLAGSDQIPVARAWLSHSATPLHPALRSAILKKRLIVRFMEPVDPVDMKLREIQAELKAKGVSYADCFDRESLSKRLLEARQGVSPEPTKPPTDAANAEISSPSFSSEKPEAFDRSAVANELRSRTVKQLREECAQRRIRWSTFIEKEELVQALVEAREVASMFSVSGAIVPGQVADLTDEQLTVELESTPSKHISTPLLLDVYATWCGPCQIMAPQLIMAAHELGPDVRVAKLDSDKHPIWPNRLKVGALPTVIVFDPKGRELERVEGALMKDGLVQLARRHVTNSVN